MLSPVWLHVSQMLALRVGYMASAVCPRVTRVPHAHLPVFAPNRMRMLTGYTDWGGHDSALHTCTSSLYEYLHTVRQASVKVFVIRRNIASDCACARPADP